MLVQYPTRLDLEFDDWLDPSLPPLYEPLPALMMPPVTPLKHLIGSDFTDENECFATTTILPVFTPVMHGGLVCLVTKEKMAK